MNFTSFKSLTSFLFLLTCVSLIHGFYKRESEGEERNLDPVEKEMISTMRTMLKEMETEVKGIEKGMREKVKNEKGDEVIKEEEKLAEKVLEDRLEEDKEKEEIIEKTLKETEPEEIAEEEEVLTSTTKMNNEETEETASSASPMLVTELSIEKEDGPEGAYAVWNANGKICLLARFEADFLITYPSKGGEEKADVKVNKTGIAKGKCEHPSKTPLLQISWQKYAFTMMFNKTGEDTWVVTGMELTYDTSDTLFDRAANAGKKTARSKPLSLFETPMSKSFYCPGEEVVLMYINNKHVVTARLKDIYLQPFGVEDGKFSPAQRCNKVVIDETPYVQDETVPLAVGCTLALITLLVLLGFSFHRAYNAAKVDYNTMN